MSLAEDRYMKSYAAHHMREFTFGGSLIGVSIAVAFIALAISFVLHQVEESAWKWILLCTLGLLGILLMIWLLFTVLSILFRKR